MAYAQKSDAELPEVVHAEGPTEQKDNDNSSYTSPDKQGNFEEIVDPHTGDITVFIADPNSSGSVIDDAYAGKRKGLFPIPEESGTPKIDRPGVEVLSQGKKKKPKRKRRKSKISNNAQADSPKSPEPEATHDVGKSPDSVTTSNPETPSLSPEKPVENSELIEAEADGPTLDVVEKKSEMATTKSQSGIDTQVLVNKRKSVSNTASRVSTNMVNLESKSDSKTEIISPSPRTSDVVIEIETMEDVKNVEEEKTEYVTVKTTEALMPTPQIEGEGDIDTASSQATLKEELLFRTSSRVGGRKSDCGLSGVNHAALSEANMDEQRRKSSVHSIGPVLFDTTKVPYPSLENLHGNKSNQRSQASLNGATAQHVDFKSIEEFKRDERLREDFVNITLSVDEILNRARQRVSTEIERCPSRPKFVEEIKIDSEPEEADAPEVPVKNEKPAELIVKVKTPKESKIALASSGSKSGHPSEIELKNKASKASTNFRSRGIFRHGLKLNPWGTSKKAQDEARAIARAGGVIKGDTVDRIELAIPVEDEDEEARPRRSVAEMFTHCFRRSRSQSSRKNEADSDCPTTTKAAPKRSNSDIDMSKLSDISHLKEVDLNVETQQNRVPDRQKRGGSLPRNVMKVFMKRSDKYEI